MRAFALAAAALSAALAFAPAVGAAPEAPLKVVATIPGPDGFWDYSSYDAARHRIYISHGLTVLSLDLDTGKLNPNFAAGKGLHSIVPVPGANVLVTTNRGDSSAKIIKASDGSVVKSLTVADDADGAGYDAATKLVVVINGDAGLLTLIDPIKQEVAGTIKVGDHLEFGESDGKGKFYVNVENTGEVAVVDLKARKVITRYKMADCNRPTGLAVVEGGRLVSSCQGLAKVLDAATGKELASLKTGPGADAVMYDPKRHLAFVPTGRDGMLNVIALSGKDNDTIVQQVTTQLGARLGAVDPRTGRIYLPTIDYNLPVAAGQRPTGKPGTFKILVVGRE